MTWTVYSNACSKASTLLFLVITPWTCECWSRHYSRFNQHRGRTQNRSWRCPSSSSASRSTSPGASISLCQISLLTMHKITQKMMVWEPEQIQNSYAQSNYRETFSILFCQSHNTRKARLTATSRRSRVRKSYSARRTRRSCSKAKQKLARTWLLRRLRQSPIHNPCRTSTMAISMSTCHK